jgi:hypothetical protein
MYSCRLKVLMPLALPMLGLGIGKSIFDVVTPPLLSAACIVPTFVSAPLIASVALRAALIARSRGDS